MKPKIYKNRYWLKTNFPNLYTIFKNAQFKYQKTQLNQKKVNTQLQIETKEDQKNSSLLIDEIDSHWHSITKETISAKGYLSIQPRMSGGYMEFLNENLIIASNGTGKLFSYNIIDKKFQIIHSNLNNIYLQQNFKGKVIDKLKGTFSVKDLFLDKKESRLLVSMNLDVGNNTGCYGLGILQAKLPSNFSEGVSDNLKFEKFFKTKECNSQFFGHGAGGRIKRLGKNIIFTVGDHDHNLHGNINIPQDKKNAIGKVIEIDEKGNFEVLSMGHRNQQGLTLLGNKIFTTEHGPKGGDEINLIISGKHYGWPYFSYGFADITGADVHRHPHTGIYEKPIYYFSPSIAISEIVFYQGKEFPFWNNKFIVSSLKEKSIYLLDFDQKNNRVISQEKINIGHRIRDLNISPTGKILIITDDGKIIRLALKGRNQNKNFQKIPLP